MDRQTRAKRITDLHVFYGQNEVVEELIRAGKIDEEYMYPFVDTDDEVFRVVAGIALFGTGTQTAE